LEENFLTLILRHWSLISAPLRSRNNLAQKLEQRPLASLLLCYRAIAQFCFPPLVSE
jgi:hypothetical protein